MMKIERLSGLTESVFLGEYVKRGKPVIVTDAIDCWDLNSFTPEALGQRFGKQRVQIFDDLFMLQKVDTLQSYLDTYFYSNQNQQDCNNCVRWFTRLREFDLVWADDAFNKLSNAWELPYFFRNHSFILPYCPQAGEKTNVDHFPFKRLCICPSGSRARLHRDPLNSNALLCQLYGKRRVLLYSPDQADFLMSNEEFVDVKNPDFIKFPLFDKASPIFDDVLSPGEIILFPKGWFREVQSIENSVSITWNFVYAFERQEFCAYLDKYPQDRQLATARFFLKEWLPKDAVAKDIADFIRRGSEDGSQ